MIFGKAKQLFKAQAAARRIRRELRETLIDATELDGKIKVVINGEQKVQEIFLDESLLTPGGRESLERFLKNALNAALSRAQEAASNKVKEITGGIDVAGLLGGGK